MQQTRLNTLLRDLGDRYGSFFSNPWRRTSLILIGVFFGVFVGSAVSTTVGQEAEWDVTAAAFVVLFTELVSWGFYRRSRQQRDQSSPSRLLFWDVLNVFKMGIVYSLFLEAFKLGS